MAWKEQVEGWELEITGANSVGNKIGTGTRLFVESPAAYGCTTTLPNIGEQMVDPESSTTYLNIYCISINYKRTHSSGANGKTATVSYSSPELNQSQEQEDEDSAAGSFSADLVTLNVQGGTTWFWYTDNATDGATAAFPFVADAGKLSGPCAESLPLTVMQIQRTKRITFDSDADLDAWIPKIQTYGGKLNNAAFLGFAKGQVLLGGISGSKNADKWDVDVVFIIRKVNDDAVTKDDWNYMPSDGGGSGTYARPLKGDALVSPGAGFLELDAQGWMYGYAAIEEILDTEAPEAP